ncbi:MAG: hypothetical protein GYA24_25295 [Candidatus Lokiarchaeota archaeon]|nr:hypothetical protein [Candidatus Lokiarchaeota archaeon]
MEIDKQTTLHKETAWKVKLDKNVMLVLNAIEDSSLPEPTVSITLSEGDRKISFEMSKEKFLNLTGVLDSFSQVCLGVEPVLAQEDYAVHESKVPDKKQEKAEPAIAPKPKQAAEPVEADATPKQRVDKVEAPARKVDEPRATPPAPARQPAPAPATATTAESRMMAKLEGVKAPAPPKVAFPPRFPAIAAEDDKEPEPDEAASQLDLDIPEPTMREPAKVVVNPPMKPTLPSTTIPRITKEPAPPAEPAQKKQSSGPEASETDAVPEWDPW